MKSSVSMSFLNAYDMQLRPCMEQSFGWQKNVWVAGNNLIATRDAVRRHMQGLNSYYIMQQLSYIFIINKCKTII
jgi:hypothetical protein